MASEKMKDNEESKKFVLLRSAHNILKNIVLDLSNAIIYRI